MISIDSNDNTSLPYYGTAPSFDILFEISYLPRFLP